jgi:FtsZ-binding cell division protein ZapB
LQNKNEDLQNKNEDLQNKNEDLQNKNEDLQKKNKLILDLVRRKVSYEEIEKSILIYLKKI